MFFSALQNIDLSLNSFVSFPRSDENIDEDI